MRRYAHAAWRAAVLERPVLRRECARADGPGWPAAAAPDSTTGADAAGCRQRPGPATSPRAAAPAARSSPPHPAPTAQPSRRRPRPTPAPPAPHRRSPSRRRLHAPPAPAEATTDAAAPAQADSAQPTPQARARPRGRGARYVGRRRPRTAAPCTRGPSGRHTLGTSVRTGPRARAAQAGQVADARVVAEISATAGQARGEVLQWRVCRAAARRRPKQCLDGVGGERVGFADDQPYGPIERRSPRRSVRRASSWRASRCPGGPGPRPTACGRHAKRAIVQRQVDAERRQCLQQVAGAVLVHARPGRRRIDAAPRGRPRGRVTSIHATTASDGGRCVKATPSDGSSNAKPWSTSPTATPAGAPRSVRRQRDGREARRRARSAGTASSVSPSAPGRSTSTAQFSENGPIVCAAFPA